MAAELKVLALDDPRWAAFCRGHDQAGIFHSPAWSDLLAQTYGLSIQAIVRQDESGILTAGLPFAAVQLPLARLRLVALPFSDHCAPLSGGPGQVGELVDRLRELHPGAALELRWTYPTRPGLAQAARHVLHLLPLEGGVDAAAARIHPMHRRNLRTARQRGVRVVLDDTGAALADFYRLHWLTRRRQGVPVQPVKFFKNLVAGFFPAGEGFFLLACQEDTCLAAALFLRWNDVLTYKYGASDPAGLPLRPNDLIFWEAIRWGCAHGCRSLDRGRTDLDNHGLRDFKTRWGAEETALVYTYFPQAPDPAESRLRRAASRAIRQLPPWFCRALGETLYRYAA